METTLARGPARAADREWKDHMADKLPDPAQEALF